MYYSLCEKCLWVVKIDGSENDVCSRCGAELGGGYCSDSDTPEAKVEFLWCLHCEKVTPAHEVLSNPRGELCECGAGGIGVDLFPWHPSTWPRSSHPEYPDIPEVGKAYPLYG